MKIYVVTKGSYSDYHILAATLDKEKAEKIAKRFSDKWDESKVEVYEDSNIELRPYWYVKFEESTGNVIECSSDREFDDYRIDRLNIFEEDVRGNLYTHVAADTPEEAIKIAAEKRTEYLAKKEGVC